MQRYKISVDGKEQGFVIGLFAVTRLFKRVHPDDSDAFFMTQKSSDKLFESLSALADGEISELELHRLLRAFADDDSLQKSWHNYHAIRSVLAGEKPVAFSPTGSSILENVRAAIADDEQKYLSLNHVGTTVQAGASPSKSQAQPSPEATHTDGAASVGRTRAWQAWIGKSAVAASVAVVFVLGLGQARQLSTDTSPSAVLTASIGQVEQPGAASIGAPLGFELPALESRNVSTDTIRNYSPAPIERANSLVEPNRLSEARAQQVLNQLHIMHAQRASANGGFGILPFARISEMEMSRTQAR